MRRTPNDRRSRIYCVLALAVAAVLFVALYQGGRWLEKKNEKPEIRGDYRQRYAYDIAESEGIFFSVEYDFDVEESGAYTVTVTGENAKGSVKFVVESAE